MWIPPIHTDAVSKGPFGRRQRWLCWEGGGSANWVCWGGGELPPQGRDASPSEKVWGQAGMTILSPSRWPHSSLPSRLKVAAMLHVSHASRVQGLCRKAPVSSGHPGTLQLFPQSKEEHCRREIPQGGPEMSQAEPPSPAPCQALSLSCTEAAPATPNADFSAPIPTRSGSQR